MKKYFVRMIILVIALSSLVGLFSACGLIETKDPEKALASSYSKIKEAESFSVDMHMSTDMDGMNFLLTNGRSNDLTTMHIKTRQENANKYFDLMLLFNDTKKMYTSQEGQMIYTYTQKGSTWEKKSSTIASLEKDKKDFSAFKTMNADVYAELFNGIHYSHVKNEGYVLKESFDFESLSNIISSQYGDISIRAKVTSLSLSETDTRIEFTGKMDITVNLGGVFGGEYTAECDVSFKFFDINSTTVRIPA